jgi:FdhD protein
MPDPSSLDAVLIAGGKSSRFGEDKAFLDWNGEPLFQRQLKKLQALGPNQLWLSANGDQDYGELPNGVIRVDDDDEGLGPVGGLLNVFKRSEAERIVVLGVDLPLMEEGFLAKLVDDDSGIVPKTQRYWEPLAAVYPREAMLAILESAMEQGNRKLQRLLDKAEQSGVTRAYAVSEGEGLLFTNLNSREDLEKIDPHRRDEGVNLRRYRVEQGWVEEGDRVAMEEPLEVRVNGQSVAVMMRTPGHDEELATGFLLTESVIESADDIAEIQHRPDLDPEAVGNSLEVTLKKETDLSELTRHVFTSSSCGVCGKATIESVFQQFSPIERGITLNSDFLLELPGKLRKQQETFDRTGGLHASALFSKDGELLFLREDVGRHNALDKVIGRALRNRIDLSELVLLVSGRISFELMQKALAGGIPAVAGISAPSSLAVKLARDSGQTLVGFLRERGFNVYSGEVE